MRIKKFNGGFTLLEAVVSLGLFAVAVVLCTGLLLSITASQRKAIAIRAAIGSANFAMEVMSKEIRTGYSYHCPFLSILNDFAITPQDCPNDYGIQLNFINGLGEKAIYRVKNYRLEKCSGVCAGDADFLPLTPPEVRVELLRFYVRGTGSGDQYQPRVTIAVQATSGVKQTTALNFQTTITQRKSDG